MDIKQTIEMSTLNALNTETFGDLRTLIAPAKRVEMAPAGKGFCRSCRGMVDVDELSADTGWCLICELTEKD